MMSRKLWVAAVVFAGLAAFGFGADSPDGEPPFGLDFPEGRSGQQFTGFATIVFRGVTIDLKATSFDSVVRLRKGGDLHVFYTPYSCGNDSCSLCTGGLIDTSQTVAIQHCIEGLIEGEVIADFGLIATEVRLKDVSDFVAEPHSDPTVLPLAADVEFTAK